MRAKVFAVLAVVWAAVIFSFSAKTAEESTEDSYWVGRGFGSIVVSDFSDWSEEEQLEFAKKVDHPIRKTAHATEYAIFATLLLGAIYKKEIKMEKNFLFPWIVATLYAGTDEFHQLFVEGRSGQISDVCLDSVGALVGILLVFGMIKIVKCINFK